MTNEQLQPGRELDALIAQKLFYPEMIMTDSESGWVLEDLDSMRWVKPAMYSTDDIQAFGLVDELIRRYDIRPKLSYHGQMGWCMQINIEPGYWATTRAMAICEAALAFVAAMEASE